jgi:hypothetical protein
MGFTLVGVGLIVVFAILGYFRGALRIVAAILSLLFAGLLSMRISFVFQGIVGDSGYVPKALVPIASILVAGIILFLVFFIVFEVFIKRRQRRREEAGEAPLQGWERWGGAVLGGVWGLGLVMLIFVGIDIIGRVEQAMASASQISTQSQSPKSDDSSKDKSTISPGDFSALRDGLEKSFFGPLVHEANPLDEKVAKTFESLAIVLSDPELSEKFRNHPTVAKFAQDPRIIEISEDPEIQRHIQNMDFYRLLDNEKIAALLKERDLFEQLKDVDMEAILNEVMTKQ